LSGTQVYNLAFASGTAGHAQPLRTQPINLKECEMPKLKTKSSAKKRFRLTGSGKVRGNVALKQHGMSKRPQKMKRKARGTMILCAQDARIVKSYMPNAK
jgi:large subunit ribosomal protein L35